MNTTTRIALPVFALASLALFVTRAAQHANAAPRSNPSPVSTSTPAIRAEGQFVAYPGAEVTVGSEITGRILSLPVDEKTIVKKGQLLVALDDAETRASLTEARARIVEANAEVTATAADVERMENLAASHAISRQELDHARRDSDAAIARRDAAVATASQLEAHLAKTRILAPISGVVTARLVQPGEIVEANTRLVTVADLHRTRIEAEVDEYDAGKIALGAPVTVSAEGYGSQTWRGTVEEIPDGVVARRLKPEDPGKPTDTRVLMVKIALNEPTPLKLSQRVQVAITPASRGS
jgi:RND family efflux transporter MFP subunit